MANFANETDARFYDMIHRASGEMETPGADRRSEQRHRYGALQKVAPYDGKWFPAAEEFLYITCYDLTRSGFSFLVPRRPAFKSIAAAFQAGDETLYFEAEVVRVVRAIVHPDGQTELLGDRAAPLGGVDPTACPALLIGCRFVRRLYPD